VGLRWNKTTDTYTRLGKAKGLTVDSSGSPNISDFDSIYPWSEMKRCNLADDLTVNAYYGDAGYIEDGSNGQVMVEIPQFWYKTVVYTDTNGDKIFEWYISEFPQSGFKLHPMFINTAQSKIYEYAYLSAYEGTLYDNSATTYVGDGVTFDYTNDIMASVSGLQPISGNTSSLNIGQARQLAENRGVGWIQQDWLTVSAVQMLYLIEYADFNSQETIGRGVVDKASGTGNEGENTGQTSNLGNSSGMASGTNGLVSISYRGIENFWGNGWKFVDGILLRDDGAYIQDDISDFNDTHTNYNHIPFTTLTSSGYIDDFISKEEFESSFFPLSTNGSSSTFVGDYYYAYNGAGAIRVFRIGGTWSSSSTGGAFALSALSSASFSIRALFARLAARK
jgi:hypothetical protein